LDGRHQEVGQDLGAQNPLFDLIHHALRAGEVEKLADGMCRELWLPLLRLHYPQKNDVEDVPF
jgi:hypothetical protein